jgi:Zn-finger nucleic acid-binding protein
MKCPVDDTTLAISDRQGIEIDYCPECRGVWLDRGELDKLIERESRWVDEQVEERAGRGRREDERQDEREEKKVEQPKKKKKMSSLLQDLMEFGQQ